MKTTINFEEFGRLLSSFSQVSGMRFSILDASFRVVYASVNPAPFCEAVCACEEGLRRCRRCDAELARAVAGGSAVNLRTCHAGLLDAVIPVTEGGQVAAYLFFGQVLDASQSAEAQWERTRRALGWHPDPDSLYGAFMKLKRCTLRELKAYAHILQCCMPYIWLEGLVQSSGSTVYQKLVAYVGAHYAERLTIRKIADDLGVSRTKLCAAAKERGTTVLELIQSRRLAAARDMLRTTDLPVARVAELVGISDYNYFSRVFRAGTGQSPSAYRRETSLREEKRGSVYCRPPGPCDTGGFIDAHGDVLYGLRC